MSLRVQGEAESLEAFVGSLREATGASRFPEASLQATAPVSVRDEQPRKNRPDCTEQLGVTRS